MKKSTIWIIVVAVVILAVIVYFKSNRHKKPLPPATGTPTGTGIDPNSAERVKAINMMKQKGGGCKKNYYTLPDGTTGVYYTYNGIEVTYQDCASHNKI